SGSLKACAKNPCSRNCSSSCAPAVWVQSAARRWHGVHKVQRFLTTEYITPSREYNTHSPRRLLSRRALRLTCRATRTIYLVPPVPTRSFLSIPSAAIPQRVLNQPGQKSLVALVPWTTSTFHLLSSLPSTTAISRSPEISTEATSRKLSPSDRRL
ncbi:hypothetical protein M431DRAFT_520932, partial [Trichoderma harzianum CBS 226.95]